LRKNCANEFVAAKSRAVSASGCGRKWKRAAAITGVGAIDVRSILLITLEDVIPELARRSGFKGTVDLLKSRAMARVAASISSTFTIKKSHERSRRE
jgi:hypothetical protein